MELRNGGPDGPERRRGEQRGGRQCPLNREPSGEEAKTRDQRPEVRASERVSFIRIAPEINPFHVYEPVTGIN